MEARGRAPDDCLPRPHHDTPDTFRLLDLRLNFQPSHQSQGKISGASRGILPELQK